MLQIHSSNTNEWYTPKWLTERARTLLGGIDLDPASCELANGLVCAERYYTEADDGLSKPWNGRVWLNPPYGRGEGNVSNQDTWSAKLIGEWVLGNVDSGLLLVNAVPDRNWFRRLWGFPLCFLYDRVRFVDVHGEPGPAPTHPNVIVFLPSKSHLFTGLKANFGDVGKIVLPDFDERTKRLGEK